MNSSESYNRHDSEKAPTTPGIEKRGEVMQYAMPEPTEVSRLVGLLRDRKDPGDKSYAVYEIDGHDPTARLARAVELEVFSQYFPSNNEQLMQAEYGDFEDCTFILVVDLKSNQPVGVMRLLRNKPNGLKSIIDIENPKHNWKKPISEIFAENDISEDELDTTVDVATIAVLKDYQGGIEVTPALYYSLRQYILRNGITEIVTILDDVVRKVLERRGCYFKDYKDVGSEPYLDSKASTPCYISFDEMMEIWQAKKPDLYDYVVLGNGLTDLVEMVLE